ncbi:hypothetical protein TSOC_011935 [Tetrabaena socialis]|uniref:Primase C-terminal 2 domain-containing protein n=1 Tax=Tetrabaena socialis TaxID=47790 RepID=A0A2J7ZPD0_9CHLO|nr:hypothetical protein TSOC_011935 [Tetrabaena socialis]|eukprot:PNH02118.1 hypothetical protein TSOC_011935 [Tetrabaena socialis]
MRFIDAITIPRSGRDPDDFCRSWDIIEAVQKLSNRPHTFVEYLSCPNGRARNAPPGKLYLDRDVYIGVDPPTPALIAKHAQEVLDHLMVLKTTLETDQNNLWFVVATRHGWCPAHGEHKLSFRPFIQGMTIRYTDIPSVIRFLHQQDFWDMSVYKPSEQLLAAINGNKGRIGGVLDERMLTPEAGHDNPLLYVVQHVEPNWKLLDLPEDFHAQPHAEPPPISGSRNGCSQYVDPIFVHDLVACLSVATSDDRERWIRVAMVLKNLGGDIFFDAWVAFSRRSIKFKGECDCRKTWDSLLSNSSIRGGSAFLLLCGVSVALNLGVVAFSTFLMIQLNLMTDEEVTWFAIKFGALMGLNFLAFLLAIKLLFATLMIIAIQLYAWEGVVVSGCIGGVVVVTLMLILHLDTAQGTTSAVRRIKAGVIDSAYQAAAAASEAAGERRRSEAVEAELRQAILELRFENQALRAQLAVVRDEKQQLQEAILVLNNQRRWPEGVGEVDPNIATSELVLLVQGGLVSAALRTIANAPREAAAAKAAHTILAFAGVLNGGRTQ